MADLLCLGEPMLNLTSNQMDVAGRLWRGYFKLCNSSRAAGRICGLSDLFRGRRFGQKILDLWTDEAVISLLSLVWKGLRQGFILSLILMRGMTFPTAVRAARPA